MDISVITPSVRPEGLEIVKKCLQKQTFPRDRWEWIVGSPFEYKESDVWVKDPGKNEGDFYSLNKTYNAMFRVAKGKLIISYQDGIWTDSDMLQHFWDLYQTNPHSCVGAVGDQYEKLDEFGKPIVCCWQDPRKTDKHGEYYEVNPIDIEFTLCGVPRQAFFAIGGWDEEYDKFCAVGEKEAVVRMDKLGYKPYLDQGLVYRAMKHKRLGGEEMWNKGYNAACVYYDKCIKEILDGHRLKLDYL